MKIEEAINNLQARIDGEFYIKGEDNCQDMKLGIEALNLNLELRKLPGRKYSFKLPSETTE